MKETQLVKQILDYCRYRSLLFWRNQSGMVRTEHGSMMKFGSAGSPDIIGCYQGKFVGIECKVGTNKPTELQLDFANNIRANGGVCYTVYTLDEFIEIIKNI